MIRTFLIIAFLIGSPREIANRPVKHVATKQIDLSALVRKLRAAQTNSVQTKALAIVPVPTNSWITVISSNTNPQFERWVLDVSANLPGQWIEYTNGVVAPFTNFFFKLEATNGVQFYRFSFAWGAGAWKYGQ